jgi:SAM-dependent methyltransferase
MQNASVFRDLTDVYDALIDWPKRLAHEGPFYRRWFERFRVQSVVDVACGTGRHAAMFHDWGLRVEGADLSAAMIARSQAQFGEKESLRWVVRGFHEPIRPRVPFDAAICVGNSLALAPDQKTLEEAWRQMLLAVRPGGLVIVQVVNWGRLPDGPCVWQKGKRVKTDQGEIVVAKGLHRHGLGGYVDLILINPVTGTVVQSESVPLMGCMPEEWQRMAQAAGASRTWLLGGYQDEPFQWGESVDQILVAERAGAVDRIE